jgi:hypothetical protein
MYFYEISTRGLLLIYTFEKTANQQFEKKLIEEKSKHCVKSMYFLIRKGLEE